MENTPLSMILWGKIFNKGGSSVSPASVLTAMEGMTDAQAAEALAAIGGAPTIENVRGYDVEINAKANTVYNCGTLDSLTVSSFPESGTFWIWFTSGNPATYVSGIKNGDGTNFQPEKNKLYKITVENGHATYDSWATS